MSGWLAAFKGRPGVQVESSVPLRVVSTAMALVGVVTAMQETECPWWLTVLSISGCLIGSYVSHIRRNSNNFIVKIWISVGILIVAYLFFNELILLANANIADARVPLTKLLMALIALHCFDLPRRRDLSVSALVGVTLMTVSATLSRDLIYAWFLSVFLMLSVYMFQLDCASRSLSRAKLWVPSTEKDLPIASSSALAQSSTLKQDLARTGICTAIALMVSLLCFAVLPRMRISLQQMRFAVTLPYQMKLLPGQLATMGGDSSVKKSPTAYYGFSEELDTNYRGGLGDQVVLRVSSSMGTYLRGMAYDNFDGKVWRMSHPKDVTDQVAGSDNCFYLPEVLHSSHVRYKTIAQEIFVEEDGSNLVVRTSYPYQIYFPSADLKIDPYYGIRSPVGVKKDMVYTVFSRLPMFDFAAMRRAPELSPEQKRKMARVFSEFDYLQLPDNLSPEVKALAEKIGGKGGSYAQAERISNYLQTQLKYDLNAAQSSPGTDTVSNFLFKTKRGSCEHFASSLAIMCRTLGIPSMLVTGYQPGQYNPFTGLWDVRLNEAHSWVEIYVRKYGWVPLDPTPNSLMGQGYQEPQSVLSYLSQVFEPIAKAVKDSEITKSLGESARTAFGSLSLAWLQGATYFPQLLFAAIGAALLLTGVAVSRRLNVNLSGIFGWKAASGRDVNISIEEASGEFLSLSRSLKHIGVERIQSETAADLLQRVEQQMVKNGIESRDYLTALENFIDLYAIIRFGFGSAAELERLKEMRRALDKLTIDLSKQRKTVVIS